jgi:hypothetical protein
MEAGMIALTIRKDRSSAMLRQEAKAESDPRVAHRLLAIASIAAAGSFRLPAPT